MKRHYWTCEEENFLRENYPRMSVKKIAAQLDRKFDAVRMRLNKLRLRKNRKKIVWIQPMDELICELYPTRPAYEIAAKLGCTARQIWRRAQKLGVKSQINFGQFKPGSETGRRHRFKKGHAPWNKGMKGLRLPGCEKGWFPKGHQSINTLRDGDIVVRHNHLDRNGRPYKWIRIKKGTWRMLHVVTWENANGKVPRGHIVVFKNGDTMNCAIDNLECITRQESARRTRETDGYIAVILAGTGRGKVDRNAYKNILKDKPLLALKRRQIELQRRIRENEE